MCMHACVSLCGYVQVSAGEFRRPQQTEVGVKVPGAAHRGFPRGAVSTFRG